MADRRLAHQTKSSALRIVFRRGSRFICGMCRAEHKSQKDAKSCLRDCITQMMHLQPVAIVKRNNEYAYRCKLCARDYGSQQHAMTCAQACKREIDRKQLLEEKVTGVPLKAPDPKKFARRQEAIAVPIQQVARVNLKRTQPHPEALPSEETQTNTPQSTQETVEIEEYTGQEPESPAPPPAASSPTSAKRRTTDVKEKFYREDAKYVCSVCTSKYFTKVEVEQCWDKHVAEEQGG